MPTHSHNGTFRRVLWKVLSSLHIAAYRATKGIIGDRMFGTGVLLLTTRGRKTGKERTTPLLFGRDGEDLVLVASFAGAPNHPAWYLNLVANPRVQVQLRGEVRELEARTAGPEERERLWQMMAQHYFGYEIYKKRTTREIPLVLLSAPKNP